MEAIGCAFDKEHSESLSTADVEDSVSALSTATLANETTQHTLQKKTNVLSERGHNNSLVLMMESCINSIKSVGPQVRHCMLSVVITVTDCLLAYMLQNALRRLVVEDHEQRKRIVATIHDSN